MILVEGIRRRNKKMAEIFEKSVLMDDAAVQRALTRISHEIVEKDKVLQILF